MISYYKKWITENYYEIKNKISKAYSYTTGDKFSEDVFHDTLIKCVKILGEFEEHETKMMENYLYIAYKTNMIREKLYFKNKNEIVDNKSRDMPDVDKSEYWLERNIIKRWVCDNFDNGREIFEILASWLLDGKSLRELKIEHPKIKGIRYKLDKIIQYIASNFDKQILYDIRNQ